MNDYDTLVAMLRRAEYGEVWRDPQEFQFCATDDGTKVIELGNGCGHTGTTVEFHFDADGNFEKHGEWWG